jgi:hypothetical protein
MVGGVVFGVASTAAVLLVSDGVGADPCVAVLGAFSVRPRVVGGEDAAVLGAGVGGVVVVVMVVPGADAAAAVVDASALGSVVSLVVGATAVVAVLVVVGAVVVGAVVVEGASGTTTRSTSHPPFRIACPPDQFRPGKCPPA